MNTLQEPLVVAFFIVVFFFAVTMIAGRFAAFSRETAHLIKQDITLETVKLWTPVTVREDDSIGLVRLPDGTPLSLIANYRNIEIQIRRKRFQETVDTDLPIG